MSSVRTYTIQESNNIKSLYNTCISLGITGHNLLDLIMENHRKLWTIQCEYNDIYTSMMSTINIQEFTLDFLSRGTLQCICTKIDNANIARKRKILNVIGASLDNSVRVIPQLVPN